MAETGSQFSSQVEYLDQHGYAMLESIVATAAVIRLTEELTASLEDKKTVLVLRCSFPGEFATTVLGTNAGIVRVRYFDKAPDRSWSLSPGDGGELRNQTCWQKTLVFTTFYQGNIGPVRAMHPSLTGRVTSLARHRVVGSFPL